MEILELTEFIKLFSNRSITFQEFLNKAQVRLGSQLRPLKVYAKDKKIPVSDLKALFENIINRNDYLTRFYNLSLLIRSDKLCSETPMKNKHLDNNAETLYKNLIRNIHFEGLNKLK